MNEDRSIYIIVVVFVLYGSVPRWKLLPSCMQPDLAYIHRMGHQNGAFRSPRVVYFSAVDLA